MRVNETVDIAFVRQLRLLHHHCHSLQERGGETNNARPIETVAVCLVGNTPLIAENRQLLPGAYIPTPPSLLATTTPPSLLTLLDLFRPALSCPSLSCPALFCPTLSCCTVPCPVLCPGFLDAEVRMVLAGAFVVAYSESADVITNFATLASN